MEVEMLDRRRMRELSAHISTVLGLPEAYVRVEDRIHKSAWREGRRATYQDVCNWKA